MKISSVLIWFTISQCISSTISSGQTVGETADGEKIFRARCGACHSVELGRNRIGPHLAGVFGRKAGSVEGARNSRALQESGIVWNEQTLDRFLANPSKAIPGTTMPVALVDARQRAAIIDYLKSLDSKH
jgi:cytochrome c